MKKYLTYLGVAWSVAFKNALAFRANVFAQVSGAAFTVFLLVAFWSALFRERAQVEGIDLSDMLLYALGSTLLTILYELQTAGELSRKIADGEVALTLSYPLPYPRMLLMDAIAGGAVRIVLRVIPYAIAAAVLMAIAFGSSAFAGLSSGGGGSGTARVALTVLSIVLGFLLTFSFQHLFATASFWTHGQVSGMTIARREAARLFSGSFIPLWFFPPWAFDIAQALPFQAMYHTPLSILIGKLEGGAALRALAVQAVWIVVLALLAHLGWQRGLRRVAVHGG